MNFNLEISLSNDAMRDANDVANALRALSYKLDSVGFDANSQAVMDTNGNTCGTWWVSE